MMFCPTISWRCNNGFSRSSSTELQAMYFNAAGTAVFPADRLLETLCLAALFLTLFPGRFDFVISAYLLFSDRGCSSILSGEVSGSRVRENYSFAPMGLVKFSPFSHDLRRGLYSCATSGLPAGHNPLYRPPSTKTVWPVMYDARSEASQTIVSATSLGSPRRFNGMSAAQLSAISFSVLP